MPASPAALTGTLVVLNTSFNENEPSWTRPPMRSTVPSARMDDIALNDTIVQRYPRVAEAKAGRRNRPASALLKSSTGTL